MSGMHVGICPRMASQGNKPGRTHKMKESGAEIAGGGRVGLDLGLGFPPACQVSP